MKTCLEEMAIAAICLLAGPAAADHSWRFDMGTTQSELRAGFTRITPESTYNAEAGYGWKSSDGLRTHWKHYSRQWEYNESRGREQPPPIYTNEITCDSIFSGQENFFLLDVPDGDYVIWLLCGRSAGSTREYHDFAIELHGGQSEAETEVKIPGPYRFERRVERVTVSGGRLTIKLEPRTDWLLAALMVFPVAEEQAVKQDFLNDLEREIEFLPPDVAAQWKETVRERERPMPVFSETDRRRGYALFARHWSEPVYPNTVPRPEELKLKQEIFACPGEYEPLTVTIHPLRTLTQVGLTSTDLRAAESRISAENVEIRSVRYMRVRPNYSSFYQYHIAPDVLELLRPLDLEPERNQRYWITVHVPEDAAAGVYDGTLHLTVSDAPGADIPWRLRVLPIRLQKNPDHIYGMYYHDPLSNLRGGNSPSANRYFQQKAEWERQDMVAHGMNCHISGISGLSRDEDGNWTMEGAETERRIALDRKYGLADHPLVVSFPVGWWYSRLVDPKGLGSHLRLVRAGVPNSFFDEVTKMVQAIEREKQKYDWPEFLYYPIDEPGTQAASVDFMVRVLRAIKRVPGVRTYVTADPSHEQFEPMWPYVDVWCCQPFVFGEAKIRRLSRERNIEFWCYPNHISGENDHTPVRGARMTWGFGFWKSGFRALVPWIYQASVGDPWNYLDGTSMDFFNRSTPEGQPIPVTLWEAYREGIDDGRYIYTLEQLIVASRARGGREAELASEAERELEYVSTAFERQEKYKYDGLWGGRDFDAYRWLLARQILKLQNAHE